MRGETGCQTGSDIRDRKLDQKMTARTSETIDIVVNGESRAVSKPDSLLGLLIALGVDPEKVAVELNREIVRRPDWPATSVADGAQIEVVQFVGGG
jgi:thiamine biosynthesis protein ThiS